MSLFVSGNQIERFGVLGHCKLEIKKGCADGGSVVEMILFFFEELVILAVVIVIA